MLTDDELVIARNFLRNSKYVCIYIYIYETNILVDFVLNKNDEGRKKTIIREKHPGRVAQDYRLAALMKKRKEEILSRKEQSTGQSIEQFSV